MADIPTELASWINVALNGAALFMLREFLKVGRELLDQLREARKEANHGS